MHENITTDTWKKKQQKKHKGYEMVTMTHARVLFWAFPNILRASLFKLCRCKHYAHSHHQLVNGGCYGYLRALNFISLEGNQSKDIERLLWGGGILCLFLSYLPTFLASQSNRANNPWVSLEQKKARMTNGKAITMTGCTNSSYKYAGSLPNGTML